VLERSQHVLSLKQSGPKAEMPVGLSMTQSEVGKASWAMSEFLTDERSEVICLKTTGSETVAQPATNTKCSGMGEHHEAAC
jgi:hypothetical protein